MYVQKHLPPKVSNWICSQVTNGIMSKLAVNILEDFHYEREPQNPKH